MKCMMIAVTVENCLHSFFSFQPGHVGIISVNFSPKKILEKKADFAQYVQ